MSLKGIMAISGMPGLFKVVAQTKNGFIVESLTDKKRLPVDATKQISMLEDISIYTQSDDLPLKEVFGKMKDFAGNGTIVNAKADAKELKSFFKSIVPEFDENRVYQSDIRKMINWFHLVKDLPEEAETENTETVNPGNEESSGDEKD